MSIEDRLRATAEAVGTAWDAPAATHARLVALHARVSVEDAARTETQPEAKAPQSAPEPRPLHEIKFLTVGETAEIMRVNKMTVYRLVHSDHLAAIRIGRSIRIPAQDVYDYLRIYELSQAECQ